MLFNTLVNDENYLVDYMWVKREGLVAEKFSKHKIEIHNWS